MSRAATSESPPKKIACHPRAVGLTETRCPEGRRRRNAFGNALDRLVHGYGREDLTHYPRGPIGTGRAVAESPVRRAGGGDDPVRENVRGEGLHIVRGAVRASPGRRVDFRCPEEHPARARGGA